MKTVAVNGEQKKDLDPRPPVLLALLTFTPNLDFPLTVGKQWTRDYKGTYVGSAKQILRKIAYEVKESNRSPRLPVHFARSSWKAMTAPARGTTIRRLTGTAQRPEAS